MPEQQLQPETWFDRWVFRRADRVPAPVVAEQRTITTLPWATGADLVGSSRTVSADTAASYGAVFSAWRYLADRVATLPLHAYRDLGGQRTKLSSLPQLFQQPSTQGTLVDWLHRAVVSLASRGNAVGLITSRDGFGFPTGIEWLAMSDVHCDDASFARPVWYFQGREVPRDNIVHIPWFPVPGKVLGLSPLAAYAAAVSRGISADRFATDWFDAGGTPPGVFKNTAKTINDETAQQIKSRLVASIRTRQPIVYGADWDYTALSVSPNEARFIETHRLSATQVAVIYGIPPEDLGGETGASLTYNTVEDNQIRTAQGTIRPWVVKLEAAFAKLLPERQYVKLAMDAVIRPDTKTRYEVYEIARRIGLVSIDELRELEDRDPLPAGQGGDIYTPQALLEKGIGTVPKPGDPPHTATPAPAPAPAGELGRPRLVEGGQGG